MANISSSHYVLKEAWSLMPPIFGLVKAMTTPVHLPSDLVPYVQGIFEEAAALNEESFLCPTTLSLPERIDSVRKKALNLLNTKYPEYTLELSQQSEYIRSEDNIDHEDAKITIKSMGRICRLVAKTMQNHHSFTNQVYSIPHSLRDFHITKYGEDFLRRSYSCIAEKSPPGISREISRWCLKDSKSTKEERALFAVKKVEFQEIVGFQHHNEAFFMTLCEHRYIVPIISVEEIGETSYSFELAYFPKSSMRNTTFQSELEMLYALSTTLEGLAHMHSLNVVHNDLKSENILLEESPENPHFLIGIVADLGLATITGVKSTPGTIFYLPPESILNCVNPIPIHPSKDIWSIGIILLQFLTLHHELDYSEADFESNLESKLYFNPGYLLRKKWNFYNSFTEASLADHIDAFLRRDKRTERDPNFFLENVLKGCLALDPNKRPTAAQLARDFKNRIDLIRISSPEPKAS